MPQRLSTPLAAIKRSLKLVQMIYCRSDCPVVDLVIVSYPFLKNPNYFYVSSAKGIPKFESLPGRAKTVQTAFKVLPSPFCT